MIALTASMDSIAQLVSEQKETEAQVSNIG